MGIIHVMDPHLSNMIAAGEVVDRPVNIVKECVENALDAGAASISVEVFEGGIKGLVITDDGCGMDEEDAVLAFARHATSKLYDEADLFNIQTMGFRGEALASIAAVAVVDLKTSNRGHGTHIRFEYGEMTEKEAASCPRGTRIEIRGLFVHTPARFKYLKKAAYEFSIIAETMNKLAIAHPDIRFVLKHDGRLIFQTSGKGDKKEILFQMFGKETAMNALPFYSRSDDFEIEGLAVQPKINRANKHFIYLTINDRLVRSYNLSKAVIEGYSEYLPPERYPIVFLNVRVDPQLVDVNVHPNKLEVRLTKEEYLSSLVIETLENLFSNQLRTVEVQKEKIKKPAPVQQKMNLEYPIPHNHRALKEAVNPYRPDMPAWQQPPQSLAQDAYALNRQRGKTENHVPANTSQVHPGKEDRSQANLGKEAGKDGCPSKENGGMSMETIQGHPMLQSTAAGNYQVHQQYAQDHQVPQRPILDELKAQYGGFNPLRSGSGKPSGLSASPDPSTWSADQGLKNRWSVDQGMETPGNSNPGVVTPGQSHPNPSASLTTHPGWEGAETKGATSCLEEAAPVPSSLQEENSDAQDSSQKGIHLNHQNLNGANPENRNPVGIGQDHRRNGEGTLPTTLLEETAGKEESITREEPTGSTSLSTIENREEPDGSQVGNAFFSGLKIIGQLKKSYILCENEDGLVIIDQHAAQERYHFEQLEAAFSKKVELVQPLIVPLRIRVTPDIYARVEEINAAVDYYGLHFEPFSGNSLVLRAIPAWLEVLDAQRFLEDMLAHYMREDAVDIVRMNRHMIATAACHSSIRFNRVLCQEEMEQVIADLCQCRQPFHCPHGRPTVITLSDSRMRKEFERG